MNIFKVSMVGANEALPGADVAEFLRGHPLAEIGVGVSKDKGGTSDDFGPTLRYCYVINLQKKLLKIRERTPDVGTLGIHVNGKDRRDKKSWPYMVLTGNGDLPKALGDMLDFPNTSIQINFSNIDVPLTAADTLLTANPGRRGGVILPSGASGITYNPSNMRVVLPYDERTKPFVKRVYMNLLRTKFAFRPDILYDASHGLGVVAKGYSPPRFKELRQGYAGGLGVDNIGDELEKIAAAQTDRDVQIYIDAEGKLKIGTVLDLGLAEKFYKNIMYWVKNNRKR